MSKNVYGDVNRRLAAQYRPYCAKRHSPSTIQAIQPAVCAPRAIGSDQIQQVCPHERHSIRTASRRPARCPCFQPQRPNALGLGRRADRRAARFVRITTPTAPASAATTPGTRARATSSGV